MAEHEAAEHEKNGFTLQRYFTPSRKDVRHLPRLARASFSLVWHAARGKLITVILLQALGAAGLAVQLLILRSLLSRLVGGGVRHFSQAVPNLTAFTATTVIVGVANAILALRSRLLAQEVARSATDRVARTAVSADLLLYEVPEFHDRLQRAQLAATSRPAIMVQELLGMASAMLGVAAIFIALVVIQPLFCLLVVVAYAPLWLATSRAARITYRQSVEQTERLRMRQYLFETVTTKGPAQEMRAFDVGGFLADRQDGIFRELLRELGGALRRRQRIAIGSEVMTGLLSGGTLAVIVWFVATHRMGLSAAGTAAGAMVALTARLRAIAGSSGGLYENSLYLEDYVSFVSEPAGEDVGKGAGAAPPDPQVIRAEAVGFSYPSRSAPSLRDASLELRRGEVVALVGENGSGKTTFAKLLAGLYRPSRGRVTWDGIDLVSIDPSAARRKVAVVFQDFVRYLLPAHDNIALGDHGRFTDRQGVEAAAHAAGIAPGIASLPLGYETTLGPAYLGGSDLSGGQWQRLALARLFFRDAPIVILDEPAASLDPRAETELYSSMRELFAGRGVLLISHRFASVRTADRIYVLQEGRVTEQGTHDELIAAAGHYAELFELQARHYRD